jgi:hypothetical protein
MPAWRALTGSRRPRRASIWKLAPWTLAALTSAGLASPAATLAETAAPAPRFAAPSLASSSPLVGGWLLARAPIPGSERSSVALIHAVDPLRSDLGVAGLMLRCDEHGFDAILVVVTPYPPSAAPQVTIAAGKESRTFHASVLPTGAALALPAAASDLARTGWRNESELSVSIVDDGATVKAVIPIPGLEAALRTLSASCPAT